MLTLYESRLQYFQEEDDLSLKTKSQLIDHLRSKYTVDINDYWDGYQSNPRRRLTGFVVDKIKAELRLRGYCDQDLRQKTPQKLIAMLKVKPQYRRPMNWTNTDTPEWNEIINKLADIFVKWYNDGVVNISLKFEVASPYDYAVNLNKEIEKFAQNSLTDGSDWVKLFTNRIEKKRASKTSSTISIKCGNTSTTAFLMFLISNK